MYAHMCPPADLSPPLLTFHLPSTSTPCFSATHRSGERIQLMGASAQILRELATDPAYAGCEIVRGVAWLGGRAQALLWTAVVGLGGWGLGELAGKEVCRGALGQNWAGSMQQGACHDAASVRGIKCTSDAVMNI